MSLQVCGMNESMKDEPVGQRLLVMEKYFHFDSKIRTYIMFCSINIMCYTLNIFLLILLVHLDTLIRIRTL